MALAARFLASLCAFGQLLMPLHAQIQNATIVEWNNNSKVTIQHVGPTVEEQARVDAVNAHRAAKSARVAADVAEKVAAHTVNISVSAKAALQHAQNALHLARVKSNDLSKDQSDSLKKQETQVKKVTERLESTYVHHNVQNEDSVERQRLVSHMKKIKQRNHKAAESDLAQMRADLRQMQGELRVLREQAGSSQQWNLEIEIRELEDMLKQLEAEEAKRPLEDRPKSHDELKVEVERLREAVNKLKRKQNVQQINRIEVNMPPSEPVQTDDGSVKYETSEIGDERMAMSPLVEEREDDVRERQGYRGESYALPLPSSQRTETMDTSSGRIDVDTEMPYGELEPFGREDTAQELTEGSIRESDEMVDQLERAEVAEEKRAVFRALTRLRGAAITSFDGVARAQTGNIDEYNKIHKWRRTHPLHHLADEESDISKWAFPDNADF